MGADEILVTLCVIKTNVMHIYWDSSLIKNENKKTIQVITRNKAITAKSKGDIEFVGECINIYTW